jgi:hypothetical protein
MTFRGVVFHQSSFQGLLMITQMSFLETVQVTMAPNTLYLVHHMLLHQQLQVHHSNLLLRRPLLRPPLLQTHNIMATSLIPLLLLEMKGLLPI